ncbi:pentapeptide repeat-containing protein [Burkholderia ambifaria]|jgi:hypothetical protein|uniref:pentapeptide repeat-containing protein n=1 Tax=Burkholderia TaxID=32008 RepID=UPI001588A8BB|nr:pentapeptide repeat-containing protein [Burkholderia ambifaria]
MTDQTHADRTEPLAQYSVFPIRRAEGVKFSGTVTDGKYQHVKFKHVSAAKVHFKNCDFSFCEFEDAYFRDATFEDCDFRAIKCSRSNFRGTAFSQCRFDYAQFFETHVEAKELIASAPARPNLRRDFMTAARVNAESLGDVRATRLIVREELRAERQFHLEAAIGKTQWYVDKYTSWERVGHLLRSVWLTCDWWFWGHGEHPWRFVRSMLVTVSVLGLLVFLLDSGVDLAQPLGRNLHQAWRGILVATYIFIDAPVKFDEKVPDVLAVAIATFRYVSLGLFTNMIFRFLSHR